MKLSVPYGDGELEFELPAANLQEVVLPGLGDGLGGRDGESGDERGAGDGAPSSADEQAEIRRALAEPIGAPRLAAWPRRRATQSSWSAT